MMMRTLEGRWEIEGISVCVTGTAAPALQMLCSKVLSWSLSQLIELGMLVTACSRPSTNVTGSLISACRSWPTFEHLQYNKQTLEVASNMICEREEGEGGFCCHTYMLYRRGCVFRSKVVTALFVQVDGKAEKC